jgi:hypothetical protein
LPVRRAVTPLAQHQRTLTWARSVTPLPAQSEVSVVVLLSALIPMMAGAGSNVDIGALASQAVGSGVAGAIVAAIIGLIKNKMAS